MSFIKNEPIKFNTNFNFDTLKSLMIIKVSSLDDINKDGYIYLFKNELYTFSNGNVIKLSSSSSNDSLFLNFNQVENIEDVQSASIGDLVLEASTCTIKECINDNPLEWRDV